MDPLDANLAQLWREVRRVAAAGAPTPVEQVRAVPEEPSVMLEAQPDGLRPLPVQHASVPDTPALTPEPPVEPRQSVRGALRSTELPEPEPAGFFGGFLRRLGWRR